MSKLAIRFISYDNMVVCHRGKSKFIKLDVLEDFLNSWEWKTVPRKGREHTSHLEPWRQVVE